MLKRDSIGIIGQYGCLVTMWIGLAYEVAFGAHIGFVLLSGGMIGAMVFTKMRGK